MPGGRERLEYVDDWLCGSRLRRELLAEVLRPKAPARNQKELGKAVGAEASGAVRPHLEALEQLGVVKRLPSGVYVAGDNKGLRKALSSLLRELRPYRSTKLRP